MERPAIPFDRHCTIGELCKLLRYYLDPDDRKEPMLYEDDMVVAMIPDKFEEGENGTVHYQKIVLLKRGCKIPSTAGEGMVEAVRRMADASSVKNILSELEKIDENEKFDTPFGNSVFGPYVDLCVGQVKDFDANLLTLMHLPERDGAIGLETLTKYGYKFKMGEDGSAWKAEELTEEDLKLL